MLKWIRDPWNAAERLGIDQGAVFPAGLHIARTRRTLLRPRALGWPLPPSGVRRHLGRGRLGYARRILGIEDIIEFGFVWPKGLEYTTHSCRCRPLRPDQ